MDYILIRKKVIRIVLCIMMSANTSGDVLLVEPDWMDESRLSGG